MNPGQSTGALHDETGGSGTGGSGTGGSGGIGGTGGTITAAINASLVKETKGGVMNASLKLVKLAGPMTLASLVVVMKTGPTIVASLFFVMVNVAIIHRVHQGKS